MEELIQQAKGELILIPEYASWCVYETHISTLMFELITCSASPCYRRMWERPPASLDDDEFSDIYDDLEFIDPDGPCSPILRELAAKKRAEKQAAAASTPKA